MDEKENPAKSESVDLLSLLPEELESLMEKIGEPKYRSKQLFDGMHKGLAPSQISTIGKNTLKKLDEISCFYLPTIERKLSSAKDGTQKYLFRLHDGNLVEGVLMKYKHGNSICVSTQVGCRMGCAFCASTIGGKVRDLAPSEILGQIIAAQTDLGERISNVVMMGIGEPLDNYDNVIKFLKLVGDPNGINIGYRHISLSTCGLADKIELLARENFPITLSISLHAASDEMRAEIMPVNKKWNIDALLAACEKYFAATGRRISFEYTLIKGKNDTKEEAARLASLLNSRLRAGGDNMPIHVNLIPVNEVNGKPFSASDKSTVRDFALILEKNGIRATVRRTLGGDIGASCGQLRRSATEMN